MVVIWPWSTYLKFSNIGSSLVVGQLTAAFFFFFFQLKSFEKQILGTNYKKLLSRDNGKSPCMHELQLYLRSQCHLIQPEWCVPSIQLKTWLFLEDFEEEMICQRCQQKPVQQMVLRTGQSQLESHQLELLPANLRGNKINKTFNNTQMT